MEENYYTHLAELYGFKCYYNIENNEVIGTNWFNDNLIDLFIWIDTTFFSNEYFAIKIISKLE